LSQDAQQAAVRGSKRNRRESGDDEGDEPTIEKIPGFSGVVPCQGLADIRVLEDQLSDKDIFNHFVSIIIQSDRCQNNSNFIRPVSEQF
jgi:hypothetical protein